MILTDLTYKILLLKTLRIQLWALDKILVINRLSGFFIPHGSEICRFCLFSITYSRFCGHTSLHLHGTSFGTQKRKWKS